MRRAGGRIRRIHGRWVAGLAALIAMGAMAIITARAQPAEGMPPADAAAVWSHITDARNYRAWSLWPGTTGRPPSRASGAHGERVTIYLNDPAMKAVQEQANSLPNGALVVLESHDDADDAVIGVSVMYRVDGYDKDAGDIFWLQATDDIIRASGRVQSCVACHAGAGNGDFVFSPGLGG